jgi:hypothetical protein
MAQRDLAKILEVKILEDKRFVLVSVPDELPFKARYLGASWANTFAPGEEATDEKFIQKWATSVKHGSLLEKGPMQIYQAHYVKVWDSEDDE